MTHFEYKIGAMSFPNEGFAVWAKTVAGNNAAAMTQPTGTRVRIMLFLSSLKPYRRALRT
jgi:hypothetical protein